MNSGYAERALEKLHNELPLGPVRVQPTSRHREPNSRTALLTKEEFTRLFAADWNAHVQARTVGGSQSEKVQRKML